MFGLGVDEDIDIILYKDLPVKLGPGRVIYITGDSGAGKTCLLRDIASKVDGHKNFSLIDDMDVADAPEKPLVDQFGDWSITQIGALLAYVGIAEPFVYLRKPKELSDGQRYRFKLAMMIYRAADPSPQAPNSRFATLAQVVGPTPVICIDEFLAFLDRETARNVAYQVRRVATRHRLCFVVATTHEDIAKDLQPNQSITMRLNLPPELAHKPFAGA